MNQTGSENEAGVRNRPGLPPVLLVSLYTAAALAPLSLAAILQDREESFWRELCIGVGMTALAMLLLQFVLSGRFERISGRAGIDLTMRFHQLAALSLAVLIVLHPVLLVVPEAFRDPSAALRRLAAFFTEPSLLSGVTAWVVALILIAAGPWRRYLPIPYEAWRLTHGIAAAAVAALAGHHVFRVGIYVEQLPVVILWILLLAIGLGSFAFVYLVRPLILWNRPYRIHESTRVGPDTWEIVLTPSHDAQLTFDAGQFAWVSFGAFPFPGFDHPFSIASAPARLPEVRFLIKESGDFTRRIGRLKPGTLAYLDAPHGNFSLRGRAADSLCLIAGGIGVAPILSILRELDAIRDPRPISLVHAASTVDQLLYCEEIGAIAERLDLVVTYAVENPPPGWPGKTGVVDLDTIRAAVRCRRPERCLAFLCGPTPMLVAAACHLEAVGLPARRIIYERFVYDGEGDMRLRNVMILFAAVNAMLGVSLLVFALR